MNSKLKLGGIYGSKQYSQFVLNIRACSNTTKHLSNNSYCAPQSEINNTFQGQKNFMVTLVMMNTIINPNNIDYLDYYVNTDNYFIFSKQVSIHSELMISDYTINTDNSILPYEDSHTDKGFIFDKIIYHTLTNTKGATSYATFIFTKSQTSLVYERSVLKFSAVISYVGGLIGGIVGLLFIIKSYTSSSLQVNMGIDIFEKPPPPPSTSIAQSMIMEKQSKQTFNFLNCVSLYYYKFLKFLKKQKKSGLSKQLNEYQEQIIMQLDIKSLLRRILKLEACINHVCNKETIKHIKQYQYITVEKAKYLRTLLDNLADQNQQQVIQQKEGNLEEKRDPEMKLQEHENESSPNLSSNYNFEKQQQSSKQFYINKQRQEVFIPVVFSYDQLQSNSKNQMKKNQSIDKKSQHHSKTNKKFKNSKDSFKPDLQIKIYDKKDLQNEIQDTINLEK